MNGKPISGPTRGDSPCRFCTDEHDEYCHGTCGRFKKWSAEIERINENRRKYYQRLEASLSNKNRKGSRW